MFSKQQNYFYNGLCECLLAARTLLAPQLELSHLTPLTVQCPLKQTYDLQVSGLKHDVGCCSEEINKADILVYQLTF